MYAGSFFCRSASAHSCHIYSDKISEKEVKIVHNRGFLAPTLQSAHGKVDYTGGTAYMLFCIV